MTAILTDFTSETAARWGKAPVKTAHSLHRSPLFSLEAVAALIDAYPREHYALVRRGEKAGKRFLKEGDLAGMKGRDVIEWIARGDMWLNLRSVKTVDPRYGALLDAAYAEIARRAPGAAMFNTSMGILVSSPNIRVHYHCDLPGQALWQIHGRKKLYVYPNEPPYLRPENLEDIALFGIEEDLPYEAGFDAAARVIELQPGEMAHWPLNAPHRVENEDMLNISVTTEHWSDEIERRHRVNLANGILRHRFGWTPRSRALSGPGYQAKAALQGVMRRLSWVQRKRAERKPLTFSLDPARIGAIRDVTAASLPAE